MFKKPMVLSALGVAALIAFGTLKMSFVTQGDVDKYKGLVAQYRQLANQPLSDSATQMREGVRKEIWFSQEDKSRLHYRIESDSSVLTLAPSKGKFDLIENLSNIRCWMQEKLYEADSIDMQQVRYLKANEGIYRYSQQQFLASSVALSLFRLPGHELATPISTRDAFLKGNAQDISFSVSGKTPQFEAHQFTASLRQEEP